MAVSAKCSHTSAPSIDVANIDIYGPEVFMLSGIIDESDDEVDGPRGFKSMDRSQLELKPSCRNLSDVGKELRRAGPRGVSAAAAIATSHSDADSPDFPDDSTLQCCTPSVSSVQPAPDLGLPLGTDANSNRDDDFSCHLVSGKRSFTKSAHRISQRQFSHIVSKRRSVATPLFETDAPKRRRAQTGLMRKISRLLHEYSVRFGEQAAMVTFRPKDTAKTPTSELRVSGSQPLETAIQNAECLISQDMYRLLGIQGILANDHEKKKGRSTIGSNARILTPSYKRSMAGGTVDLPSLMADGFPVSLDKMTQAQLRAFVPQMLRVSTNRLVPHWRNPSYRPKWWPDDIPWNNVKLDDRSLENKAHMSWTEALRKIIRCCYDYHDQTEKLYPFGDYESVKKFRLDDLMPPDISDMNPPLPIAEQVELPTSSDSDGIETGYCSSASNFIFHQQSGADTTNTSCESLALPWSSLCKDGRVCTFVVARDSKKTLTLDRPLHQTEIPCPVRYGTPIASLTYSLAPDDGTHSAVAVDVPAVATSTVLLSCSPPLQSVGSSLCSERAACPDTTLSHALDRSPSVIAADLLGLSNTEQKLRLSKVLPDGAAGQTVTKCRKLGAISSTLPGQVSAGSTTNTKTTTAQFRRATSSTFPVISSQSVKLPPKGTTITVTRVRSLIGSTSSSAAKTSLILSSPACSTSKAV